MEMAQPDEDGAAVFLQNPGRAGYCRSFRTGKNERQNHAPMRMIENGQQLSKLHQMQATSRRAKKRLVSRRGGSTPRKGVSACCSTDPPPLT